MKKIGDNLEKIKTLRNESRLKSLFKAKEEEVEPEVSKQKLQLLKRSAGEGCYSFRRNDIRTKIKKGETKPKKTMI